MSKRKLKSRRPPRPKEIQKLDSSKILSVNSSFTSQTADGLKLVNKSLVYAADSEDVGTSLEAGGSGWQDEAGGTLDGADQGQVAEDNASSEGVHGPPESSEETATAEQAVSFHGSRVAAESNTPTESPRSTT